MPTGYTSDIEDGITFNEFIMNCARAFGACISLRDSNDPIPEKFEVGTYEANAIVEAKARLKMLNKIDPATLAEAAELYNEKNIHQHWDSLAKDTSRRDAYEAMLKQVKAWKPPTKEHKGLKEFMVEQINSSIEWDCNHERSMPEVLTPKRYLELELDRAKCNVEYFTKSLKEEKARVASRNKWIKALRDSIKEA